MVLAVVCSGQLQEFVRVGGRVVAIENDTAFPYSPSPISGTAGRQTFTFVARDTLGASNVQYTQFLFSKSGIVAVNACYISYDPVANVFYLLSDDATLWYGLLGGSANTVGNAQCTIFGATSGSTKAGTDLTTTVDISFRSGFAGLKSVYQFAGDTSGSGSGWISMGTWNDTGDPHAVELISLSPNLGSGVSQTFTTVTKDGDGATTIPWVEFVMNLGLSGVNGCFIHYDRASNDFFLLNDAGTAYSGLVGGSAGTVSNSQCTLNGIGSTGSAAGTNLTITYNLSFSAGFAGAKQIYMQTADNTGIIEVWHQMGSWTASTLPIPGAGAYDDADYSHLSYTGTWYQNTYPSLYAGTQNYTNVAGSSVSFTFTGTTVSYVYGMASNLGYANVYIDNSLASSNLDEYSAPTGTTENTVWQKLVTYTGLSSGTHTIKVVATGNNDGLATDSIITVDAFIVGISRNDNDAAVSYTGSWTSPGTLTGLWNNDQHYSNTTGNSFTFSFSGTFVTYVYAPHPNMGIANITIDGVSHGTLDEYNANNIFQGSITFPLSAGSHTLTVTVSGSKNSASSATYVIADQFLASQ